MANTRNCLLCTSPARRRNFTSPLMSFWENSTRDDEAAGVHKFDMEDEEDGGDDDVVDCVQTRR